MTVTPFDFRVWIIRLATPISSTKTIHVPAAASTAGCSTRLHVGFQSHFEMSSTRSVLASSAAFAPSGSASTQ